MPVLLAESLSFYCYLFLVAYVRHQFCSMGPLKGVGERALKTQGREIGRKPEAGQLKGEPGHCRVTSLLESPLRKLLRSRIQNSVGTALLKSSHCFEPLSHKRRASLVLAAEKCKRNDYFLLTSRWEVGKKGPLFPSKSLGLPAP